MFRFELSLRSDKSVEIVADAASAQLIADALDIINPDTEEDSSRADHMAFELATFLGRFFTREQLDAAA